MISSQIKKLSQSIESGTLEIDFAFLFGSVHSGKHNKNSDVDIAVYLNTPATLDLIAKITDQVENVSGYSCDLVILNTASEVLRFEALKGQLLFVRESKLEKYAEFYSITCREYEDKMAWMKRQLLYRGYAK